MFDPDRKLGAASAALIAIALSACAAHETSAVATTIPSAAAQVAAQGAGPDDPAIVRFKLLQKLDAQIDLEASRAHLNARLAIDEVLPIPYLGVDADPKDGGMLVAHVYPLTAAERAGIVPGDRLRTLSGAPTTSKVTLGAAIRSHRVGDEITLVVARAGGDVTLRTTLGPRPEEDEDEEEQFPDLSLGPVFDTKRIAFDFESDAIGALPAAFRHELGGHGLAPSYVVRSDAGGRFLRQESQDTTGIHYPMAIVNGFRAQDVAAKARFRFVGGRVDKAAGIVLRYRDPYNYLVARVNAAEADLRIFRVANGVRKTLPNGIVKAPCDDDRWHTLEFTVQGSTLTATFDGTATTVAHDSWFLEGGVGTWTKADSVSEFDDLVYEPIAK